MPIAVSKRTRENPDPHSVSFQIADGTERHDCVLKTKFPTKEQAKKYLLSNWPMIERLARNAIAAGHTKDGQVQLVMM